MFIRVHLNITVYALKDREKFISETLSRLTWKTDMKDAVSKADVVVEAIVENLAAKQGLFAQLDKFAAQ